MKQGVDYIGITCVFYCHDGKGNFLLHKRTDKCKDEKGKWDCGGGTMELGETFEETIRREIREEYDTECMTIQYANVRNVSRDNDGVLTHWVAVIFAVQVNPRKIKNGDPEKISEVKWFTPNNWPEPLHLMFLTHFEDVRRILTLISNQ